MGTLLFFGAGFGKPAVIFEVVSLFSEPAAFHPEG
jgi:hypothetical protein